MGWDVRRVVRAGHRSDLDASSLVEVGDICTTTRWQSALEGVDCVLHLAGRAHLSADDDRRAFFRVNTDATVKLAQAAARVGVRRFVYVSTVKVFGEVSPEGRGFAESDPPGPADAYARSKLAAEMGLRDIGGAMEVVILRPPLVYGPSVGANFLRLLEGIDRGVWFPFDRVSNRRSLIYVGNLASAIHACLDHPAAAGMTFVVSDGEDVSTAELIRRIGKAMRKDVRCWPVPSSVLWTAASVLRRTDQARRLLGSLAVDSRLIRQRLDWSPPSTVDQGLMATSVWFSGLSVANHTRARA
jgi:nucleoside-diphosphate-sugar epimerase